MSRGRRISRVKFVPPSPAVAEKYLREWPNQELYQHPENFPKLDKQNLFDQTGLLELEIGCGTGEFLNAKAQANSQIAYIGIDISRRAIYHAVNKAGSLSLDNILYIRTDVKLIYPLFEPDSLNAIYLNFPDPNYRNRNLKHRIFTPTFLEIVYPALTDAGKILVVTDQHPFLLDMLDIAENDPRYIKTHEDRFLTSFAPINKTRFQKAWERLERPIFRFELAKA